MHLACPTVTIQHINLTESIVFVILLNALKMFYKLIKFVTLDMFFVIQYMINAVGILSEWLLD